MANVMPAWLGAMSAWLLKCPAELQAQRPIEMDTNLQQYHRTKQIYFIYPIILLSHKYHQTFYLLNFYAYMQSCKKQLLAPSSMPVCPAVHSHKTTRLPLDDFSWSFRRVLLESVKVIQISLKWDKNYRHITWRPAYSWLIWSLTLPYILESNPHFFYSFRGLKNQMRIRFAV
jgi:hypothetical protein